MASFSWAFVCRLVRVQPHARQYKASSLLTLPVKPLVAANMITLSRLGFIVILIGEQRHSLAVDVSGITLMVL